MSYKVESLTEAQKSLFPVYIKRWTDIGLSTEPVNKETALETLNLSYQKAGLKNPEHVWFADSPMQALNMLQERCGVNPRDSINSFFYGQHEAEWLAFYEYFREVCNLTEETEMLTGLNLLAKNAGWVSMYEHVAIICSRPNALHRDENGRLHNTKGPALSFPDGMCGYYLRGISIDPELIENPNALTPDRIQKESNVEVRRVLLELYGESRFLEDVGAKMVHKDEFGELYVQEFPDDEPLVRVKVINDTPEPDGTRKAYFLSVHPELRPLLSGGEFGERQKMTARNAVASTFGLYGKNYAPEVET